MKEKRRLRSVVADYFMKILKWKKIYGLNASLFPFCTGDYATRLSNI